MKLLIFLFALCLLTVQNVNVSKAELYSNYNIVKVLEDIAKQVGIDPIHLVSVCGAESVWDELAEGDDGMSFGACQLQEATARDRGYDYADHKALYNIYVNGYYAAKQLKWCNNRMNGDWILAYACYNRGNGWVKRRSLKRVLKLEYIQHVIKCYIIANCRQED